MLAAALGACLAASACQGGDPRYPASARSHAGALWAIVSTCVDREPSRGYCACPAFARSCCGDPAIPDAAVVWAETPDFVAIRDMTACGCGAGFVAGLALPRARITGIEDPKRPDAIWPFAWDVARSRIPAERDIGLVINPAVARTQDQMHVHVLRLKPGVRARLDAAAAAGSLDDPAGAVMLHLDDLTGVFTAAQARVGASRMFEHGILVARAPAGDGFLALLTLHTSPQSLTVNRCRS